MLHLQGDSLLLSALFLGGNSDNPYVPSNYYFGLDNRSTLSESDTMGTIFGLEPSGYGYQRQTVSSTGTFAIVQGADSAGYVANSPILSFTATGGNYSIPVQNLFMTDQPDYSGNLIASVPLNEAVTITNGQLVSMMMVLSLRDTIISCA